MSLDGRVLLFGLVPVLPLVAFAFGLPLPLLLLLGVALLTPDDDEVTLDDGLGLFPEVVAVLELDVEDAPVGLPLEVETLLPDEFFPTVFRPDVGRVAFETGLPVGPLLEGVAVLLVSTSFRVALLWLLPSGFAVVLPTAGDVVVLLLFVCAESDKAHITATARNVFFMFIIFWFMTTKL